MELKRKNPFTYLFKSNDTSAFFSKKEEEESEENTGEFAEEAASTEKAMQNFFGVLNGTAPSNYTAVSSTMVTAKPESTEQKQVETLANSIVLGSFGDKAQRQHEEAVSAMPVAQVNKMLDTIKETASKFVEQLNKEEAKNQDSY